jgi:hypothetical protein
MLSHELALSLKNAGLKWEPKEGDWFNNTKYGPRVISPMKLGEWQRKSKNKTVKIWDRLLWLPSLLQLLQEIEKRGWQADSVQANGKYACDIAYLSKAVPTEYLTFIGDTREEAVGKSLLWILEQEAGDPA